MTQRQAMHAAVDAKWKAIIDEASTIFDPFYTLPLFHVWRYEKERIDMQQAQQDAQPAESE